MGSGMEAKKIKALLFFENKSPIIEQDKNTKGTKDLGIIANFEKYLLIFK